ncbi:hypothetical protein GE115_14690 [Agromyces sp. CFH 90414]|uniref:Uncharacterized protein n=1 Tax=Agromyces agglutinans TaxID=2662258 RepID=A0A6I2F8E7_9MICO|nr:DUF6350 family protein [Agromyces agglutinans]MRG61102.1 hypothetical protein [Agromyces agglutinans]
MTRLTCALLAALEAAVAALIGLGIAVLPMMLLWSVHFGLTVDLAVFLRAAADVWLLGHGVDLVAQLDPVTADRIGLPGAGEPFPITIAVLGFGLVTILFARRIGRRAAATGHAVTGCLAAMAVAAGIGGTLAILAADPAARPSVWQGFVLPAVVVGLGAVIGAAYELLRAEASARPDASPGTLLARWRDLPEAPLAAALAAVRIGAGSAFGILAVAAVLVTVLIAVDYATIVGLSQALGAGADGGIAIAIAELALLPNVVVWAASWLLGPGFALGAGSSLSPTGTLLGPVPGLPLAGILPAEGAALGIVWLIVPLVLGFAGATVAWPWFLRTPGRTAHAWWMPVAVSAAAGLVAGVVLGLLAWWSGGAVGPGRLAVVGPEPLPVAAMAALTVFLGSIAGAFTARAKPRGGRFADERSAFDEFDRPEPAYRG